MLILGINAHHADAAAALYADGRLVAAVAEERLNRVKHCAGFPSLAVAEVLRIANVSLSDVDQVGIARDSKANLAAKAAYVLKHLGGVGKVAGKRLRDRAGLGKLDQQLVEAVGLPLSALKSRVRRVEHHLCHAASSFFASPFERAAILTLDGFGDFASCLAAVGEGSAIRPLWRITYPHSLGILYTAICQFIGYDRYGDEGKVMGLAPYGEPRYMALFEKLLRLTRGGRYELDLRYFNHHTQGVETGVDERGSPHFDHLFTAKLEAELGKPRPRGPADTITQRERDIAASLQRRLEQAFVHVVSALHAKTGCTDLCLAGGVALNSVANGKLLKETPIRRIYVQPAAGDDGTAAGVASWLSVRASQPRFEMRHGAWGSRFSEQEIARAVSDFLQSGRGEPSRVARLEEPELLRETAAEIAKGKVVGWFQGAMEWGPRALGQRSILAHPGHPGMKALLNARIKHREPFRPFAPSVIAERQSEYFDSGHDSPFMLMVYGTRPEKRSELSAVDHVDHTGRVQTVHKSDLPLYHGLISEFGRQTGTWVLLNTSFNENEPIVCTPAQALDCFARTQMDAVVLGSHLIKRGIHATSVSAASSVQVGHGR
ncbi:MAG: Decarbamoylnovobiocin carbamoyltransferase [Planctomycetes bacterium]|nr:Decarbamoylnovobiocin carbamoyltransferase [Planctomycetota bacterium]HRJ79180.1 carbamoyltransferase C-terminal domain-containing protein [Planctomycetota bacterium]